MVSKALNGNTFMTIWRMLTWSLHWLWEGRWPDVDWNNNRFLARSIDGLRKLLPLAGTREDGLFGLVWVIKGDLDWVYDRLRLANFRALAQGPCCLCPCAKTTLLWSDFRLAHARWINAIYSAAEWRERFTTRIPLFNLPGVSVLAYAPDVMHAKHMGTDMYYYASVLWLACYKVLPDSPAQNLVFFFCLCKQWWREHPSRRTTYGRILLQMFINPAEPYDHYPMLKGRAAEVRHLAGAILFAWEQIMSTGDAIHKLVRLGLRRSWRIVTLLDEYPREPKLPPVAAAEFEDCVFVFLGAFTALAQHYMTLPIGQRLKLFNITIKAHYLAHAGLLAKYQNPRLGWCYSGEDYMKHMKLVTAASSRGNKPWDVTDKVLERIARGLHIAFQDLDDGGH